MRCDSIILLGWQQSFLKAYMLKRKEPRRVAEYQAVPGTSQDLYPLVCGHTARAAYTFRGANNTVNTAWP